MVYLEGMTTPASKAIKVSAEIHAQIHELAQRRNVSAQQVLVTLLDPHKLVIPMSDEQRGRWIREARNAGMTVQAFVVARVEAALMWGADPTIMKDIIDRLPAPQG